MNILLGVFLLLITLYTLGFAITLWKGKQKFGAFMVFILSLAIIVLPFFSIFKR